MIISFRMLTRTLLLSCLLFYCHVICWNRYDFDFGTCHKKLDGHSKKCRTRAEHYWGIKDEKNQRITDRQFCCSAWDYMFCMIEKARTKCNLTELDHMISASEWKQHQLESNYSCQWFTRDSDYLCHFHWYYYVYLFTAFLFVLSLAAVTLNCGLRIILKKRRRDKLLLAHDNFGYQDDTIQ